MKIINMHGVVGRSIRADDFGWEMDNATGDITLDLKSGGGLITEGVAIINKIRSYNRGKVVARVSYAASMATQIALAADEVQVYDNSIFMIHNAQGVAIGDYREMAKREKVLKALSAMLAQAYINQTGKTRAQILKMMDDETYLFGGEIEKEGFADMLLSGDNNGDENKTKDDAIAYVNLILSEANEAMKEEDVSSEQLTACIGECGLDENSQLKNQKEYDSKGEAATALNSDDQGNKEIKVMDLAKLKADHPELYAKAVAAGVDQERQRVTAHLTMGEASGDMALATASIENGDEMSASLNAKYMAAQMKRLESNGREAENAPDMNTGDDAGGDDRDEAMAKAVAAQLGVDHE